MIASACFVAVAVAVNDQVDDNVDVFPFITSFVRVPLHDLPFSRLPERDGQSVYGHAYDPERM